MDFQAMTDEEIQAFDSGVVLEESDGPERVTKDVTLRELAAAIRKNGVRHVREQWFNTGNRTEIDGVGYFKILGACAMGQAAINLGVDPNSITFENPMVSFIPSYVVSWNDNSELSLDEIADTIEKDYTKYLDESGRADVVDYTNGVPEYILSGDL